MADAIFDITDNGLSLNKAAAKHGIPPSTLSDRFNGRRASKRDPDARPSNTRLSDDEEKKICHWILRQERLGYPPSYSALRQIVSSILQRKGDLKPVGLHWAKRFVTRHSEIKSKIGRRQESSRFDSFTPRAVN